MSSPYRYQSLTGITNFLTFLLVIDVVMSAVSLGSDGLELRMIDRLDSGAMVTDAELEANDSRQATIGTVQIGLFFVVAFVFLRWVYLAACNARSFSGTALSYSPGWAVGWYFVPIMNLVRPYQAMKEIFQASSARPGEDWMNRSAPKIVGLWWGLWIVGGVLGQVSLRTALSADSIESFRVATYSSIVQLVESIILSAVVITMVRRLYQHQESRSVMSDDGANRCRGCGEPFDTGARVCPMCGNDLPTPAAEVVF